MNVFLWHVHGSWTTALVQGPHRYLLPKLPGRGPLGRGRAETWRWPDSAVEVTPEQVKDVDAMLDALGRVVPISEDDIARFKATRKGKRSYEGVPLRLKLSEEEIARFSVNRWAFPGVDVVPYLTRSYPLGAEFAHTVGYVGRIDQDDLARLDRGDYAGTSHVGKTGIERYYEDRLHGQPGYEQVEVNADHRPLLVCQWIDDRRAVQKGAAQGVVHAHGSVEVAGEFVQDLDRLHAALAVADQHRMQAARLVFPGDDAGKLLGILVGAVRPRTVARVADARFRVAHARKKPSERFHQQMHRKDAAVKQHDPRRRSFGKHLPDVAVGEVQRIECEQPLFERAIARRSDRRGGCGRALRRHGCKLVGRRLRHGRASREHDRDRDRRRGQIAKERVHTSASMRRRTSFSMPAIASAVKAAVRYDRPAHNSPFAVVIATASGDVGPVGTPRT